ncbi:MAG: hypothetical protein Fur0021_37690 [Candidatus Promineifilaceae bacterium]
MHNKRLFVLLLAAILTAAILRPDFTAQASVTLSDFRAVGSASHITLLWETATELDNFGFHLWRAQVNNLDDASRITANLIPSQVGGQPIGASYEYEDNTAQPDVLYYYWLEAVDVNGLSVFYGPEQGMMSDSDPLGTATPGGSDPTPLPTSTLPSTQPPLPANTAAPTPTPRPQTSPTPTRQPTQPPPPTANVAAPEPTDAAKATDAPPAAGIPPITPPEPTGAPPQPPAGTVSSEDTVGDPNVAGNENSNNAPATTEGSLAAGDQTAAVTVGDNNQLEVVGANTLLETPSSATSGGAPPATGNSPDRSLPPAALLGLAAGIFLSLGGLLAAAALFKRRQTSK